MIVRTEPLLAALEATIELQRKRLRLWPSVELKADQKQAKIYNTQLAEALTAKSDADRWYRDTGKAIYEQ